MSDWRLKYLLKAYRSVDWVSQEVVRSVIVTVMFKMGGAQFADIEKVVNEILADLHKALGRLRRQLSVDEQLKISRCRSADYFRRKYRRGQQFASLDDDLAGRPRRSPDEEAAIIKAAYAAADRTGARDMLVMLLDARYTTRKLPSLRQIAKRLGISRNRACRIWNEFLVEFRTELRRGGIDL